MKQKKTWVALLVIVALLALGVAYAAISGTDLVINGTMKGIAQDEKVDVYFSDAKITTFTGIDDIPTTGAASVTRKLVKEDPDLVDNVSTVSVDADDDTKAYFEVKGLTHEGDKAILVYTIKDRRNDMDATLEAPVVEWDNPDWFTVECVLSGNDLTRAEGNSQTATVTITLNKTVVSAADEAEAESEGTITITANPVENK